MSPLGRRRLPDEQRRAAASLNVRFNKLEWEVVERKAAEAGVSPTEWARLAALDRNPPPRRTVPKINETAWRELARLVATLNGAVWRFRPGDEGGLRELLLSVRGELHSVRMALKGELE